MWYPPPPVPILASTPAPISYPALCYTSLRPLRPAATQRQGSHKQIASLHGRGGPATTILETFYFLSKDHNKAEQKTIKFTLISKTDIRYSGTKYAPPCSRSMRRKRETATALIRGRPDLEPQDVRIAGTRSRSQFPSIGPMVGVARRLITPTPRYRRNSPWVPVFS